MAVKIDTLDTFVSKFANGTTISTDFTHEVYFRNATAVKSGDKIIPQIAYSGSVISNPSGLLKLMSGGDYKSFTNYEELRVKSRISGISSTSAKSIKLAYSISKIGTHEYNTVSYDLFERINSSYKRDELEFKFELSTDHTISLVLLKAPSRYRVEYPERFNSEIHTVDSFWDYTSSNIDDICESSKVSAFERIPVIRVYSPTEIYELSSGDFRQMSLTNIGRDGRYVRYSEISSYASTDIVSDSLGIDGIVHNGMQYPLKDDNVIIDAGSINQNNKLEVSCEIGYLSDMTLVTVTATDSTGLIKLSSETFVLPPIPQSQLNSTIRVSSKSSEVDLIVDNVSAIMSDEIVDEDPIVHGRYAPPLIQLYTLTGSTLSPISPVEGIIEIASDVDVVVKVLPRYSDIANSKVRSSLDVNIYLNTLTYSLTGETKYGPHTATGYILGDATTDSSIISRLYFNVVPLLPRPLFIDSINGEVEVAIDSEYDVLYSTDGNIPDIEYRSNVALYTKPLKITKKTIIKAYAVFNNLKSCMVEHIIDPVTLLQPSNTPTIAIQGNLNGDMLTEIAVATIGGVGVRYYTIDGTDPSDESNPSRRIYTTPFNILPVGSKTVELRVYGKEAGKYGVLTTRTIQFAFICNPWRISESTEDLNNSLETIGDVLKLNVGTAIERASLFEGGYYFTLDIVDVVKNSSLVFGLKKYMSQVNNLSEGEDTGKFGLPSLTFTDRVGDVVTCSVGYRYGIADTTNYDTFGAFDWNINTPLKVSGFVKNDITVGDRTLLIDASRDMVNIGCTLAVEIDNLLGYASDASKSIVVDKIPPFGRRLVKVPVVAVEGTTFNITSTSNSFESELVVASDSSARFVLKDERLDFITIKGNHTLTLKMVNGLWVSTMTSNMSAYNRTQRMKLTVNGISTDYSVVSTSEHDYLMMMLCRLNEYDAHVKIGVVSGGCL